jgi:hypothetical protein
MAVDLCGTQQPAVRRVPTVDTVYKSGAHQHYVVWRSFSLDLHTTYSASNQMRGARHVLSKDCH